MPGTDRSVTESRSKVRPKPSDRDRLEILLVEDDDVLISDMSALQLVQMHTAFATTTDLDSASIDTCDVILVNVDLPGALDLIARIANGAPGPVPIALVSPKSGRTSLEFSMLRAELRGAVIAIPKPVDAIEIAYLAAREHRRATIPDGREPSELETMISQHMVT